MSFSRKPMMARVAPLAIVAAACLAASCTEPTTSDEKVPVGSVSVSPASGTIAVGQSIQLSATVTSTSGKTLTARPVSWTSSASNVASVTNGSVQGLSAGTATITASSEGKSGSATITVQPPPVNTVEVTPSSAQLQVGGTQQLQAVTKAADGSVLTGRTITWSTSAATVATVVNGLVTAIGPGVATITATSEGKSGTSTITVLSRPLLTVAGTGNGAGTVSGTGIACSISAGAASGDCTENYNAGTSVTLTAAPTATSNFAGWTGACTGTGNCTFTINAAATVTANFALKQYQVQTSSSPANGGTTSGAGTYNHGQSVTVTATPAIGWQFVNWTESGNAVSTSASYAFTAEGPRTLVANFEQAPPRTLTVLGGGNGAGSVSGTGYACNISAGATSGDCAETVPSGTSVTLTATPATGSTFTGWTGACTGTGVCTVTVGANVTATATFTLIQYTVTTSSSPANGGTTSGGGTFNYGTSVTVTATPVTNWSVRDWTEGGNVVSTGRSYTFTLTGNRTLVANFVEAPSYALAVSGTGTGAGSVTGSGIACNYANNASTGTCNNTYISGTNVTLTATPTASSTFAGWSGGTCSGSTPTCVVSMTAARTVVAQFTIRQYTIAASANPSAGGTVTGAGTYNSGATVTLRATPNANYDFGNWTESGTVVGADPTLTFTATANRTLVANFNLKPLYRLTVTGLGNGTGNVAGTGIACTISAGSATGDCIEDTYGGSAFTLTATPTATSNFIGWSNACAGTGTCNVSTTGGNKTVTARFDLKQYSITATVSPAGSGTVSGTGTYNHGSTVTLTGTRSGYYRFYRWTSGGTLVSYNNPYSFTATASRAFVAEFLTVPDLYPHVYYYSCTSCPYTGSLTIGIRVYNYGLAAAGASTVGLYLPTMGWYTFNVPSIAAGGYYDYGTVGFPVSWLGGYGSRYFNLRADYGGSVAEYDFESNNTRSFYINVY